jgi:hypothetical protein
MFRTLQDRLPKDLVLAGIDDIETANRYLRETYLAQHNARFAVQAAEAGSAFVPVSQAQWRDVLCVHEDRKVAPDNTVAWNSRRLQIPQQTSRAHYVQASVSVRTYPNADVAIFHGPRCLMRWTADQIENMPISKRTAA